MKRSYTAAGDKGQYVCVCLRARVTLKVRTRVMRQIYDLGGGGAYTNLQ